MISTSSKEFKSIDPEIWIKYFSMIDRIQSIGFTNKHYAKLRDFVKSNKQLYNVLLNDSKKHMEKPLFRLLSFSNKNMLKKYFPILDKHHKYILKSYGNSDVFSWTSSDEWLIENTYGVNRITIILKTSSITPKMILYSYGMFDVENINDWNSSITGESNSLLDEDALSGLEYIVWHIEPIVATISWNNQ